MTLCPLHVKAVIPVPPTLSLTPGADSHLWELPQGSLGTEEKERVAQLEGRPPAFS